MAAGEDQTGLDENDDQHRIRTQCHDFLRSVLTRTEEILREVHVHESGGRKLNPCILTHLNFLDSTVKWNRQLVNAVDEEDKHLLENLLSAFLKLYERLWRY